MTTENARNLNILIADDDESVLWVLEQFLIEREITFEKAKTGTEAAALLKTRPFTLAILDINMPGLDGLDVMRQAKASGAETVFIIMTAESTMENTLNSLKLGAFDYITKPFDLTELDIIVDRAIEDVRLKKRVESLTERIKEYESEGDFIGKSKSMQSVFKTVGKAAPSDIAMLILGESGTGKELVARSIHRNSPRAAYPFVAINTAAIPKELLEAELFGHERGAFTGATENKKGKFELADNGTLFLDEIGDMSLDMQSRVLRALQEKEFYRVGGKAPVKVDVRIIAATHRDLAKAIVEKSFREDLYYRLNGVALTIPPLRERKSDIRLLADHFMKKIQREFGGPLKSLSDKAINSLENHDWPGNVRELENTIGKAALLTPGTLISAEDLGLGPGKAKTESLEDIISARLKPFIDRTEAKRDNKLYEFIMPFMERPLIKLVLDKTKGNQVQTAELLGINRNTLRKKIRELKIKVK